VDLGVDGGHEELLVAESRVLSVLVLARTTVDLAFTTATIVDTICFRNVDAFVFIVSGHLAY
jgi:hypothetical protein